jgi:O-methyltransferase involved in polyketide biosynthesis
MTTPARTDDDTTARPNAARMYDYWLGGYHNFAIDRAAADALAAVNPDAPLMARANRAFLQRAVAFLLAQGIRQFLDVGSGLPTRGNVHDLVRQARPAARVVYVDVDPVAVAHSRVLLEKTPTAAVIEADARDPAALLDHPDTRRLLDFARPVGVLLFTVLHFLPDREAHGLMRALRDATAPGSYVAISHGASDPLPTDTLLKGTALYQRTSAPVYPRPRAEIEEFFAGLAPVSPGVVYLPAWRPTGPDDLLLDAPARACLLGGVGRRP